VSADEDTDTRLIHAPGDADRPDVQSPIGHEFW
jgi:hypothetical protein